ncbi:neutral/alkaline non-lysosomal ceramidase N-terminal domain-containing protein [Cecembia lonarensis]|uniref:Neutral/alkaline non-lysosomal ceramidase n=1 Tax=Cecembia lonarensis (strain CCUG 58316 / KCTC 22772 / LW9) TaxID=1225176 RepID=K1LX65_CECL9|nr:neutral/alkaline non-lysosomal ceramidase N-terminal domain-containing protein [Cecembia lonarensis]EKB48744.1 Neutral/alkaline non-lysosomal ceramidase [Cecembia lonarensis LW9]
MKGYFCSIILFILLLSCGQKEEEIVQVGVSKAVINPPLGAFIAGDKQNRRFTGVFDSLYVKAAVFYDGNESFALVTVDCIGLLYQDLLKIREKVGTMDLGIPFSPENIVISSTHTHSGPDVVGLWGEDYTQNGVDPDYMDFLVKTTAEQIQIAASKLENASAKYGSTEYGHNWVANICEEEIDRSVTVLQFLNDKGQNLLSLTNFACHPTYLDAVYNEVSADYVAGFYQEMEKQLGGEHIFLQGAIGGWIQPIDKGIPYTEVLQRGSGLANAAVSALKEGKNLQSASLSFRNKKIDLPVENEAWQQLAAAGIIQRAISEVLETEVVWFSIGEANFATHPGETAPVFGLQTKAMMPEGPQFVLGLGQDALGYIVKPEYFEDPTLPHAPYLTRMSLGKDTGHYLMEVLETLSQEFH